MIINTYQKEGINFIEVSNDLELKVAFADLGASVFNIYLNNELMTRNVKNIQDFKRPDCYYGKTIGRTSNRIKGNKVVIDGKTYTLENNEGPNVLHGGKQGFSNQRFKYELNEYDDSFVVTFSYKSKDLESGYPGNVEVTVKYIVYKKRDQIDVIYHAFSDKDTLLSLTNHSYFSLGDKDISNLELQINGSNYLDVNRDDLLSIEIKPVNKTMDFSKFKKIVKDIDSGELQGKMMNGYDSYFYFDKDKVAVLRNNKYQLEIATDFEGLQMYTSNYKPSFKVDDDIQIRDSVALEPSDSFLNLNVLKKGKEYKRFITYTFNKVR